MSFVVLTLMIAGGIVMFVGGIMFLIAAFKEGVGWGLGCLFVSFPVSLIFLVKFWQESKRAFFINLAGAALFIIGVLLSTQLQAAAR